MLCLDVNEWKKHSRGLNQEIISSNNTLCRKALQIILDSKVISRFLTSVSALWAAHSHGGKKKKKTMLVLKIQAIQIYEIYFSASAETFPVNDCRLDYLVSLHKNLMLTNDTALSRWFIYGGCTIPIVGTAQWLDGLTHLHHLASRLSYSFCHCLGESTLPVFNACLNLSWTYK